MSNNSSPDYPRYVRFKGDPDYGVFRVTGWLDPQRTVLEVYTSDGFGLTYLPVYLAEPAEEEDYLVQELLYG